MRRTGIPMIGDVPWGTHFCQFYQDQQDLVDILVPYFKTGLEDNDFCMWITSAPLHAEEAKCALAAEIPNLDTYLRGGQIEILDYQDWYKVGGVFDADRVLRGWVERLEAARLRGFDGLRLSGNTFWLEKSDWRDFTEYEAMVDDVIGRYPMLAICTYSLAKCGAAEIMDVVSNHAFALIERAGSWQVIQSAERKRIEASLRESEDRRGLLADVLDKAEQPVGIGFPDGRVGIVNRAMCALTGYSPEEMGTIDWRRQLTPPEWAASEAAALAELERTGKPVRYENEFVRKDGSRVPVELLVHVVRDEAGKVRLYYAFVTDISERKRAEEFLRRESEQRRLAIEAAELGAWDYRFDTGDVFWDQRCRNMFGVAEGEQIEYAAAIARIHPDDRSAVDQAVQSAIAGAEGGAYHQEFRVVWPDDSVHWIASHGRVYFEGEGDERHAVRFIGVNMDITARRQSEEVQRQQREWLRVTLTSIGDAVMAADTGGRVTFLNPVAASLTGWTEAEALGRPAQEIFRLVDEETGAPREDICARVLRDGCAVSLENHTALVSRDGRVIPIEDSAAPIKDSAGRASGAVLVFHDVTEKRRAQQALQESEQRVRRKLDSILSPEGDIGSLALGDIIDVRAVQALMDDFYALARVPMAMIDLKGQIVVGVGWQDICTKFHRVHPTTCKHCIESDTQLSAGVPAGEFKLYKCKNNMWDLATPIVVGGQHVGNLFSGQFFFAGERLDYELFRTQARQYGFPEEEYLAALDAVPRLSREAVDQAMGFLLKLGQMLSLLSYSNIKLARSVAERDRLMQLLNESAERLNRAQQIAHLGSWELDVVRNRLSWSDEVYRIFGMQPQEFGASYEAFLAAVHPDDRAAVDAAYSGSLREGKDSYEVVHRVVRRGTGELRWVHEKCEHVRDGGGAVVRSVGMVQDITERKLAEERIRDQNAILQGINRIFREALACETEEELGRACLSVAGQVTNSPLGFVGELNGEGRFVATALSGSGNEKCPLQPPAGPGQEPTGFTVHGIYGKVLREGKGFFTNAPESHPESVGTPAGHPPLTAFLGVPLVFEGKTIGMISVANRPGGYRQQDQEALEALAIAVVQVFMRKRAEQAVRAGEERLRQAQKMESIGVLAGGIAHDFNNLLTSILGNASLLELESPPETGDRLHAIIESSEKAASLTRQLLAYAGKGQFQISNFDVARLVHSSADLIRVTIPRNIELLVDLPRTLPAVRGDSSQIQQVVMNLVINAAEAFPQGTAGQVWISGGLRTFDGASQDRAAAGLRPGRYVVVSVRDNGCGMNEETKARIFDPFFTTKFTGRGLGLAAVQGILRSHQGAIVVESSPGLGSTFTVYLPCCASPGVPASPESQASNVRFATVLVVDDEEAIRAFTKAALERLGHRVILAENGRQALALLAAGTSVDVVLLDIIMPALGGAEAYSEIRKHWPNVTVLIATGYSRQEAHRLGIPPDAPCIEKPYTVQKLAGALQHVLESRACAL